MTESSFKLAIVVSQFNRAVTEKLLNGVLQRLTELDVQANQIKTVWVPGAVEIPLLAKRLAKSKHYQAIVCLGAVIRGETDHYNYVCQQVSFGCQQVALEYEVPIIFGVLTTTTKEQAFARAGGERGNKGADWADAAVSMIKLMKEIEITDE
ncbi:6,7-dimethyl-8-ribityllumazine synthase [Coxiella burnetii]|uniref:6,7-dimethyl-8-ribityllumazine synthase n=1 Tax=Coxiella burnetii (strain Dugway 5J108-111) TaxID=434922 RepID=RISB_COXBN|nr:6,7-dimethyl-8-ribityllumazine synthase [Coxiella burnetii]A9KC67.1 RecName: Full=6,7-dimethyl-8-ribityllumazine synthase; Short=DMRL synthase; Short=LS; Short=Lumazine synthase [Coxiella burnetii Dugway 5J108-111]ABS76924.1 6,7-dimethyl-8-ribityllumazine synthase [Coxiella burnetii Dugway 5J108-111]OYK80645.1 6,7-dimethyl-8-ribityllumazine synthase [Coxiella burnetii]OYK82734.1 6,7-dimethyl-8-ribityllumazine synthase [Coxiella burnetii]